MNNKEDPLALEWSLYLVKQRPSPYEKKKQKTKGDEHVDGKQTRGSLSRLICKSLWLIEMYNKCWWD